MKDKDKDKEYIIKLNKEQLYVIAEALELSARMRGGQITTSYMKPLEEELWKIYDKKGSTMFQHVRDTVDQHLKTIKKLIWELDDNTSFGIGHNEKADLEYEMYKAILSRFEKEKEEECLKNGVTYYGNVHSGEPLNLTKFPKIKVEQIFDSKQFDKLPKK